jgi:hypothetical protein
LARPATGIDLDRLDALSKGILEIGVRMSTSSRQDEPDQPRLAVDGAASVKWI